MPTNKVFAMLDPEVFEVLSNPKPMVFPLLSAGIGFYHCGLLRSRGFFLEHGAPLVEDQGEARSMVAPPVASKPAVATQLQIFEFCPQIAWFG